MASWRRAKRHAATTNGGDGRKAKDGGSDRYAELNRENEKWHNKVAESLKEAERIANRSSS